MPVRSNRATSLLLALAGVSVALLVLEGFVRISGLDFRMIVRPIFFQGADLSVHRISEDPILHYELKPSSQHHGFNPYSKPPREYHVTIDENGARRPAHAAAKPPGTFRILAFGGSTLYGGSINDSQTLPAALERRLNQLAGVGGSDTLRFEVWNFGVSAYTLGQATRLARQKLIPLSPDLILVQHHNQGCWPFLMPNNYRPETYPAQSLAADPTFYWQYFPAPKAVPAGIHRLLMKGSALYRFGIATLVREQACDSAVAWQLNADAARALSREAEEKRVPVIYFAIPSDNQQLGKVSIFPELADDRFIDLFRPGRDSDFYDVHPRPDTLDEFAQILLEQLLERRVLPTPPPHP